VALGVRMRTNILCAFRPVRVTNTRGRRCAIVDGGRLSHFPIERSEAFRPTVPAWLAFGFALVSELAHQVVGVRVESPSFGPLTRFTVQFQTAVVAHDAHAMAVPDGAAQTIRVDDLGTPPTQFDLIQSRSQPSTHQAKPRPGAFWRPGMSSRTRYGSAVRLPKSAVSQGRRGPR
jgi:hypothetical protein